MSFQAMAWAHAQKVPDVECKVILLVLANRANNDDNEEIHWCWPSIPKIAAECVLSENTVRNRIQVLSKLQLITVQPRAGQDGRQTSHFFYLQMKGTLHPVKPPPSRGEATPPSRGEAELVITEPVIEPKEPEPPKKPNTLLDAWLEFKDHCAQSRRPITDGAEREQWAILKTMPPAEAIQVCRDALASGHPTIMYTIEKRNRVQASKTGPSKIYGPSRNVGTCNEGTPGNYYDSLIIRSGSAKTATV